MNEKVAVGIEEECLRYSCVGNPQPRQQDRLVADLEEHLKSLEIETRVIRVVVDRLGRLRTRCLRFLRLDQVKIEIPKRFIRYDGHVRHRSVRLLVMVIALR